MAPRVLAMLALPLAAVTTQSLVVGLGVPSDVQDVVPARSFLLRTSSNVVLEPSCSPAEPLPAASPTVPQTEQKPIGSGVGAGEALFAPTVVSSRAIEDAGTLAPDGKTFVFTRRCGQWGQRGSPGWLSQTRLVGETWTAPEVLPFSGIHDDGDPTFSPDGRRLFFTSTRPVVDEPGDDRDIWVVERTASEWGEPEHLGPRVNSPGEEYSPSVIRDGSLYFASTRQGGFGQGDLYVARREGSRYSAPRNLGPVLNSPRGEWNVHVVPDESLLIFEASERPTNRSASGDLYVTYRHNGTWAAPVALAPINTPESELNARLSPDGSWIFFARSVREESGHRHANVFAVPAADVLPDLASQARSRVVVVSRSGHELVVIEAGSWRPLFRYSVGSGPHEVAVSDDGRFAYTANYGVYPEPHEGPIDPESLTWIEEASGTITEVDLTTGESRAIVVPNCARNHGILISTDGRRLWSTCEEEGTVQEIDIATATLVRTWSTARGSHQLVATPDESVLVATNVQSASVSLIRPKDETVTTVRTGRGAEGVALSPDGRTLWVGNGRDDTLSIVDVGEGRVLETVPSGGRFPVKLAFAPGGRTVWVVNTASRSVVAFDADRRAPINTYEFETPPLGILTPPTGDLVLVTFPRRNELVVLSATSAEVLAVVPGIIEADGLAWIQGENSALGGG